MMDITFKRIMIFKFIWNLFAITLFLIGFFKDVMWLTILGGSLIVLYEIFEMLTPGRSLFPVIFAIILAVIIKPWFVGVFWAYVILQIIGLPVYIKVLLSH